MRALLAQLSPAPGDLHANAATVVATLQHHPDADLAVFPELFLCGYDLADLVAVRPDHPAIMEIRKAAHDHRTAVIVGFAEERASRDGTSAASVANAVACIDTDGSHRATYRKTHLFGDRENDVFTQGDELTVVTLNGTRTAPLVCFDVEFPEPARAVTQQGAQLLVTVAANMEPYAADHALAARARALDNRRPHLYVNRVGTEAGLTFVGGSAAIAPDGTPSATLGDQPGVVCVEIDPAAEPDGAVDYLAHVRNDLTVSTTSQLTEKGAPR